MGTHQARLGWLTIDFALDLGPGESGPARPTGEKYAVGYRGVPFSDWLDLFLEYAMGLAHTGKAQEAYKVCESARDAVVFSNSKEDMFLIHVAWAGKFRTFVPIYICVLQPSLRCQAV